MDEVNWYNRSLLCRTDSQLYSQPNCGYASTIMMPSQDYISLDDRPLDSYLDNSHTDEWFQHSFGTMENYFGTSLDVSEFDSLLRLPDDDLMHILQDEEPELPGLGISGYASQIASFEGRLASTEKESPPTPTFLSNDDEEMPKKRRERGRRSRAANEKPRRQKRARNQKSKGNRSIHLWEFLKEMLDSNDENSGYIKWISKTEGIFQLVNSSGVARLWGQRKNRKNMTYEKMSRALRYYYEKDILERVPNARLIYKFGGKTKVLATENSDESLSDSSEN